MTRFSVSGNRKALISVFHDELTELADDVDPSELANANNWRAWTLDLDTLGAKPIEEIAANAGGFNLSNVDGRSFALIPSSDYATSDVYEIFPEGSAEHRWTTPGWVQGVTKLR